MQVFFGGSSADIRYNANISIKTESNAAHLELSMCMQCVCHHYFYEKGQYIVEPLARLIPDMHVVSVW